ncbi:MAG: hypothetical protein ACHQRK_04690 [Gemmatimonadales bacterium]
MRQRNYWVVVANVAVMAVLAGCSDNTFSGPVAPSGAASNSAPVTMMLAPAGRPSLSLSGGNAANTTADFTVGPQGGVFFVGNHAVVFPKKSICDPNSTDYNAWDAPCKTIGKPMHIHAVVRTANGRTWVDFSPELRFAPSTNSSQWVWMFMYTPDARGATGDLSRFNILYAQSIGGATIDDAAADPTLRTYVDTNTGVSVRRIKHFSGYTASAGRDCETSITGCGDIAAF